MASNTSEYGRQWRRENAEHVKADKARYHAEHLEQDRERSRLWRVANKAHVKAERVKYISEHRDEVLAKRRAWAKTDSGKLAKKAYATYRLAAGAKKLSADDLVTITSDYGGFCPYCGNRITDGHIDHVVPLIDGGRSDLENLVYVCARCNLAKGAKSLIAFLLDRAILAEAVK